MGLKSNLLQALGCPPDSLVDVHQRLVTWQRVVRKDQI
jgi:hypothetical protein